MKKVLTILFVIFLSFIIGCGKSDKTENKDVKKDEKKSDFVSGFYCKIDGKDFSLQDSLCSVLKTKISFTIYAKIDREGGQYDDFFCYFDTPLTTGDFNISRENKPGHIQYRTNKDKQVKSEYDQYWSDAGKLTITKIDDKGVEGTFSFTATGFINDVDKKINITEGKFKIKFM